MICPIHGNTMTTDGCKVLSPTETKHYFKCFVEGCTTVSETIVAQRQDEQGDDEIHYTIKTNWDVFITPDNNKINEN